MTKSEQIAKSRKKMVRVPLSLLYARNFLFAQVFSRSLAFLEKNPEANVPRLLALAKKVAIRQGHKNWIEQLAIIYRNNPVIYNYFNHLLTRIHPRVKRRLGYNFAVNYLLFGSPYRERLSKELGIRIPNFILVDPTGACNLNCEGCWAGKYSQKNSISPERLDRLFNEAKELGMYWVVFSGGEPFCYPHLFDLVGKHSDIAFMAYTNGTLINEKTADKIIKVGNFSPVISIEGWKEATDNRRGAGTFDKIIRAMDLLRERGAIFGISLTITRYNCKEVTSDEFIDFIISKGAVYGWSFHYIPIGRNPNLDLMVTPEQRAYLAERIPQIRATKPIQIADFWNDGEITGGCIAGGRNYFHINARGDVEPCAFVHFAIDNINGKSLLEVLKSPLFTAYQKRQPFNQNHLLPCPIIDNPTALREIIAECGARPTHEGAETVLEGSIGRYLDHHAQEWSKIADEIWSRRHLSQKQKNFEERRYI